MKVAWVSHKVSTGMLSFQCSYQPRPAMEIEFTTRIFKEGRTFVAQALELDVSSCGGTKEKALRNLKEAVRLFLEEAEKMGTLQQILEEAGYGKTKQKMYPSRALPLLRTLRGHSRATVPRGTPRTASETLLSRPAI